MKDKFYYGMRLRGFSPGCQPRGCIDFFDDPTGQYYNIIVYERKLTEKELFDYELDEVDHEAYRTK